MTSTKQMNKKFWKTTMCRSAHRSSAHIAICVISPTRLSNSKTACANSRTDAMLSTLHLVDMLEIGWIVRSAL